MSFSLNLDSLATSIARVMIDPQLPWSLLTPVLVGSCLIALLALFSGARGGIWRFLLFTLLTTLLLNPSLLREKRTPVKDISLVLVDRSSSNQVRNRPRQTETALAALRESAKPFAETLDLNIVEFGQESGKTGIQDSTNLSEALEKAMADIPRNRLGGVIAITDGQIHDLPLPELSVPMHVLLTGVEREQDRRLTVLSAPGFGIVGQSIQITVRIEDNLDTAQNTETTLIWRVDDGAEQSMQVKIGKDIPLSIPITHGGQTIIALKTPESPNELTIANNRKAIAVNGVRDRLKVLLISGQPHNGERTWRNLLKADPNVDLVHFTILRGMEQQDGTPINELSLIAFPVQELFETKLPEFDLIIFDSYQRFNLLPPNYLQNIVDFVDKGGALLESSGTNLASPLGLYDTPLGQTLPGKPTGRTLKEDFRPTLTVPGRRHPVTAGLPGANKTGDSLPTWGRWFAQIETEKQRGTILMTGINGSPLLILDHYGKGRVAQFTSDQMWLWTRGFDGGGPQAELLRRVAHWLMQEPELNENDLRAHINNGQLVIERRRLEPDQATITITDPNGKTDTVTLVESEDGWARQSVPADVLGVWRVTDGTQTAFAVSGAIDPPELRDLTSTTRLLATPVNATGGSITRLENTQKPAIRMIPPNRRSSGLGWVGIQTNHAYTVESSDQKPLLPKGLALLLGLLLLTVAWRREAR